MKPRLRGGLSPKVRKDFWSRATHGHFGMPRSNAPMHRDLLGLGDVEREDFDYLRPREFAAPISSSTFTLIEFSS